MKYSKSSDDRRRERLAVCVNLLLAAPRILAPLGILSACASVVSACVPAMRYEEAVSAAEVEAEGRRRAEADASSARGRAAALEAELKTRDQKLELRDQKLAEANLSQGQFAKERDETSSVLDQLRSDLARANENVKTYAANNQRLERELSNVNGAGNGPAATAAAPLPPAAAPPLPPAAAAPVAPAPAAPPPAAAPLPDVAGLSRMVETALAAAGFGDKVKVVRRSDGLVLAVEERVLFASGSAAPRQELLQALDLASRWLEGRPSMSCRLREAGTAASVPEALGRERRERLVKAIEERKLGQRIVYQPGPEGGAAEVYELVLSLPPAPSKALTPTPSSSPPRVEPPAG